MLSRLFQSPPKPFEISRNTFRQFDISHQIKHLGAFEKICLLPPATFGAHGNSNQNRPIEQAGA
jgi:hypothetical protein